MSNTQPLRCLTVKQPFASLICWGVKPIENRTQKTNIRGTVLIHAGAQWYKDENEFGSKADAKDNATCVLTLDQMLELERGQFDLLSNNQLPLSAIIGEVEIIDCVQNHPSVWAIPGYWHWVLDNAVMYPEPIPCKGALSFWKVGGALLDQVFEQRFLAASRDNYI